MADDTLPQAVFQGLPDTIKHLTALEFSGFEPLLNSVHQFMELVIELIFIEVLLCVRHPAKCQECSGKQSLCVYVCVCVCVCV
jgi:hypothetical protein